MKKGYSSATRVRVAGNTLRYFNPFAAIDRG